MRSTIIYFVLHWDVLLFFLVVYCAYLYFHTRASLLSPLVYCTLLCFYHGVLQYQVLTLIALKYVQIPLHYQILNHFKQYV